MDLLHRSCRIDREIHDGSSRGKCHDSDEESGEIQTRKIRIEQGFTHGKHRTVQMESPGYRITEDAYEEI